MGRPRVEIDLAAPGAGRHAADLARGGLFVPGEELELNGDCDVVIHGGGTPVVVAARVVFADGSGIGVELRIDAAMRAELVAIAARAPAEGEEAEGAPGTGGVGVVAEAVDFTDADGDWAAGEEAAARAEDEAAQAGDVAAASAADAEAAAQGEGAAGADDDDGGAGERAPLNVYERLRGMSLVQQYKVARPASSTSASRSSGTRQDRCGSGPAQPQDLAAEVARIGRMGTLPRPLLETIVNNGAWLRRPRGPPGAAHQPAAHRRRDPAHPAPPPQARAQARAVPARLHLRRPRGRPPPAQERRLGTSGSAEVSPSRSPAGSRARRGRCRGTAAHRCGRPPGTSNRPARGTGS